MQLRVDFPRLQADVEALSAIGRRENHGIYRMAFTSEFFEACDWLKAKAQAADLDVHTDEAFNVHARVHARGHDQTAASRPDGDRQAASVMTGSHLDSVPGGGALDGALGVVVGLECLRRLKELDVPLTKPVELCAFADEEGRFGGMFGSQAMAGNLTPEMILSAQDLEGIRLVDVFESLSAQALSALRAQRHPDSVAAFVELHIEQGPILDSRKTDIGVVEGIVGLLRWTVRILGQTNHAGSTPMDMRQDAFVGLAEIALQIPELVKKAGSGRSVATIGRVQLSPGAANVIPGQAEFSLDIRDLDEGVLASLSEELRAFMSEVCRRRGLMFEFEQVSALRPVASDPHIMQIIEDCATDLGDSAMRLPSGAAHDTQMMARLAPVGMIFLPSLAGRSHSAAEWTSWEAIEKGANVLLNTLHRLAQ